MIAASWRDRVFVMPVLMPDAGPGSPDGETGGSVVRLCNRSGWWNAISWPSIVLPCRVTGVAVCEATLLDVREDLDRDPLALVDWRPLGLTQVLDLLPESLCPIAGTVLQTCSLVKAISSAPLRRVMAKVLTLPNIHETFWTSPASLTHHHSYPGGLAQHSFEVALAVACMPGLAPGQRDVGVSYALLHDIGKVYCYADGRMTEEGRRLGHEAIGYRELQPVLEWLRGADQPIASTLDVLLSGEWKRSVRLPAAAIGEIVRAMDRFSAAKSVGNVACVADQ